MEGIYTKDDLAGPYVVSHALHEQTGADQFDFSVYIATAAGVSDADAEAAIAPLSERYPNAELQSRAEYIDAQAAQVDQIVNLMYGLLGSGRHRRADQHRQQHLAVDPRTHPRARAAASGRA